MNRVKVVCFWHPQEDRHGKFCGGGVCVWMGLRHMQLPYFEVLEGLV